MRRGVAGFTMLEAMIVVALIGILASLAIPGFGRLSASTKVKSASTELYLGLIRARSESVKRNRIAGVVAISGDEDNWQAGWRVIADGSTPADGDLVDPEDRVVYQQGALPRVAIKMAASSVEFRPTGRIVGAAPAFDVTSQDPAYGSIKRCVSADLTGRPYIKSENC